ncbi:hypothetical protein AMTRI_Chr03g149480 [Amborella trichopoda]
MNECSPQTRSIPGEYLGMHTIQTLEVAITPWVDSTPSPCFEYHLRLYMSALTQSCHTLKVPISPECASNLTYIHSSIPTTNKGTFPSSTMHCIIFMPDMAMKP